MDKRFRCVRGILTDEVLSKNTMNDVVVKALTSIVRFLVRNVDWTRLENDSLKFAKMSSMCCYYGVTNQCPSQPQI